MSVSLRSGREVSVAVFREGRVLVMRSSRGGTWSLPAGGVEVGEAVRDGAARELREETGLVVEPAALIDVGYTERYPTSADTSIRHVYPLGVTEVTLTGYAVEAPLGWEPVLSDEHVDAIWTEVPDAIARLYWPHPGGRAQRGVVRGAGPARSARGCRFERCGPAQRLTQSPH
ncbi:MAG: NUDIX domain-containing protein [Chloroflexi bacterium]|nr:NUDIX domain-containing protein [Chloroflexota bacterium]